MTFDHMGQVHEEVIVREYVIKTKNKM